MSNDKEELFKRYEKLPAAVKDAMFAEASADKIEEIGRKHGLLIDKIGALADEVGYFMLGMTHPQDFKGQIMRSTGLPETKVGEIIEELNKTIFLPIREHLSALHNVEESGVEMSDEPRPERPISFAMGAKKPDVVAPMIFPQSVLQAETSKPRVEDKIPPAPDFIKTFASQDRPTTAPQPSTPSTPTPPVASTPATPSTPTPPAPFKANDPYHEPI